MEAQSLNLLIIDDRMDEHDLYEQYLSDDPEYCYRFFNAYTGEEGEKIYSKHKIDCVLLDYNLPDINGIEVLKRLSDKDGIVPAVMLTGEGSESLAVIAMRVGVQDYMPKRALNAQMLGRTIIRAMERTRMMREVEMYRRDLERSNQDLERFASIAAHDLRAPLRAITQHLDLIKKYNEDRLDENSLTSMRFACDGAIRMRALIDSLFEFSKIGYEKQNLVSTDAASVLENAKANLSVALAEKSAHITYDSLPVITADRVHLTRVFQNLLGNAITYCNRMPQIHISARRESDLWLFSVRDNGIGIPKANLQKVFNIFSRLHTMEEYPGTGMGLAICERIVRSHGGNIWAEFEPGHGSTFYFTLPMREKSSQGEAA